VDMLFWGAVENLRPELKVEDEILTKMGPAQ